MRLPGEQSWILQLVEAEEWPSQGAPFPDWGGLSQVRCLLLLCLLLSPHVTEQLLQGPHSLQPPSQSRTSPSKEMFDYWKKVLQKMYHSNIFQCHKFHPLCYCVLCHKRYLWRAVKIKIQFLNCRGRAHCRKKSPKKVDFGSASVCLALN